MNAPLNASSVQVSPSQSLRPVSDKASPVAVVLYFSGGGMRASALSYGVLQELARTPTPDGGRLLDCVEAISAVSGGSFTAAYYCLYGDRLFQDFETGFLKRDVQTAVIRRCSSPVQYVRLLSARFARSDLAAEYYDKILFHGATFGDLLRAPARRPSLLINATDIDTFSHFSFTQDTFDLIGSDLTSYSVSRAVAASSAVPVVLTPVTLRNYAANMTASPPPITLAAGSREPAESPSDAFVRLARSRLNPSKRPYIHLMDGGLADNLGLSDLLVGLAVSGGWEGLLQRQAPRRLSHILLIVVNAATDADAGWSQSRDTPGVSSVIKALSKSSISRTNELLLELVRESLEQWNSRHPLDLGRPLLHLVAVDFSQLSDPNERAYFSRIPTRLQLPAATVDRVVAVGARILRESPELQRMLSDLEQEARRKGAPQR